MPVPSRERWEADRQMRQHLPCKGRCEEHEEEMRDEEGLKDR